MRSRRLTIPTGAGQGVSGCVASQDPPQPPTHSPSSRKLSTHCSTASSWSAEPMSRCEGQGTASSVLRAVWMLARLPAERGTRPPPETARLVRGWSHRAGGGRWGGEDDEQLGEEGWDVAGGMEEHPQEALDRARRWPWAIRAVPRVGSTGHPQTQKFFAPAGLRAAAHPAPCPVPKGQDHSLMCSGPQGI